MNINHDEVQALVNGDTPKLNPKPTQASEIKDGRGSGRKSQPTEEAQSDMIVRSQDAHSHLSTQVLEGNLAAIADVAGEITAINDQTSDAIAQLYTAADAQFASMLVKKLEGLSISSKAAKRTPLVIDTSAVMGKFWAAEGNSQ